MKTNVSHFFLEKIPKNFNIDCWVNFLNNGDYQSNHIHDRAWLSGVYYVDLPISKLVNEKKEGWIEFNRSGYDLPHFGENHEIKKIKPELGMFIFFPSYVWHGTIPFQEKTSRVSISFDLIPE